MRSFISRLIPSHCHDHCMLCFEINAFNPQLRRWGGGGRKQGQVYMINVKFYTHDNWHKAIENAKFQKYDVMIFVFSRGNDSSRSDIYPWK